jgi:hypothetical protein
MPDVAKEAFGGFAVMIIGVAKGEISGIPPVEMLEIKKGVQRFLGTAGPGWDVIWVPIQGSNNQVLVILVDPPLFGQGPFPCMASSDSLVDGRVYIRADGETREANAEELNLLVNRRALRPKPELDFSIDVLGDVASVQIDDEATIEDFLSAMKEKLLAALPSGQRSSSETKASGLDLFGFNSTHNSLMQSIAAMSNTMSIAEERTEGEYRSAIENWELQFRAAWASAKNQLAASLLTPTVVRITNLTSIFLHDVEVRLQLNGAIRALEYLGIKGIHKLSDLQLPDSPRVWGPRKRSLDIPTYSHLPGLIPTPQPNAQMHRISFKNKDSVEISVNIGDLRPLATFETENNYFVLIVSDISKSSIQGTWQLTARDHHEVISGAIHVPVAKPKDFTAIARQLLNPFEADGL